MMLAHLNAPLFVVNAPDANKRDSMCSVVSVNSALSLEYLENPHDAIARLNDFEDGPGTELASNESTPVKEKMMSFDFGVDDNARARKRRAEHLEIGDLSGNAIHMRGDEMLAALGDSSSSLFGEGNFVLPPVDMDTIYFEGDNFDLEPEVVMMAVEDDNVAFERSRSQSSERRRIQNELLSRLEKLDGIELTEDEMPTEQHPRVILLENDGTPAVTQTVESAPSKQGDQPARPEDPEPKLGIYNEKQRVDRLNAYREKRKQRVYGKVRYVLRQRVSEARPRVKGRFVKQNSDGTMPVTPDRELDGTSSSAGETPKYSPSNSPSTRQVQFQVDQIPSAEASPPPKRGRSAWDMFKRLSIFAAPARPSLKQEKRPSLPATFSEKLLQFRRKSTTAASTASGKARRRFSRDEFFDEDELQGGMDREPERKRATSMKKWDQ